MNSLAPPPSGNIWVARAVMLDGVFAPVLLLIAALGTQFGLWGFQLGLLLMMASLFIAVLGLIGAAVVWFLARKPGRESWRGPASIGALACALVIGVVAFYAAPARSVPPIHDISTDLADPPGFSAALIAARGNESNPLQRSPEVDRQQRAAYADLATLRTGDTPQAAHERARGIAEELGWEIVTDDVADGRIEATATTRWMGFKDDVVIRVRMGTDGGTTVDLRSVSRVGVSDVGANAARIRAFSERFATP